MINIQDTFAPNFRTIKEKYAGHCPNCKNLLIHAEASFYCPHCGFSKDDFDVEEETLLEA